MVSKDQAEERKKKTKICIDALVGEKLSNKEIEEKYGIPSSTVQRYLTNEKVITDMCSEQEISSEDTIYLLGLIKELLKENKERAARKGGKKSQELNSFAKNETGQFTGSGRKKK